MIQEIFSQDTLILKTAVRLVVGFVYGLLIAGSYVLCDSKVRPSAHFILTTIVLPPAAAVVLNMVGSDMAKAISIGGVFALIRYRSVPGDSRDIFYVFFALGSGLACAIGCYISGLVLVLFIGIVVVLVSNFGLANYGSEKKVLKITVPENLNFKDTFDDVFERHLIKWNLSNTRTTNMGTLFLLTYDVVPKKDLDDKKFLDELRTRNGNLNIIYGNPEDLGLQTL